MFFRNAISARAAKRRMIDERPSIKVRDHSRTYANPYVCHCSLCRELKWASRPNKHAVRAEIRSELENAHTIVAPVDDADQHDNAYWNAPDDDTYFPDYMEIDSRRSSWVAAEKYILDLYPPGADEIDLAPPAA